MSKLLVVFVTLFVIAIIAFTILNFVGCPMYPRPKFTCAECEQSEVKNYTYRCRACTDEVTNELLSCATSRGTRECYKSARKASDEQQQKKA